LADLYKEDKKEIDEEMEKMNETKMEFHVHRHAAMRVRGAVGGALKEGDLQRTGSRDQDARDYIESVNAKKKQKLQSKKQYEDDDEDDDVLFGDKEPPSGDEIAAAVKEFRAKTKGQATLSQVRDAVLEKYPDASEIDSKELNAIIKSASVKNAPVSGKAAGKGKGGSSKSG
jgi:hypothetical protein